MSVLQGLKPEKVFRYFEEICRIPHGSGNTKEISDFLTAFAKERNLEYIQDENHNVIIRKEAAKGYEDAPTVILQGHCDMVTEKTQESLHDFMKDGLELCVEGDYITAKNTTLGGDDGIAVAYMMAILDDDTLRHPALEAVITTDEEIGLLGAAALDCSCLKGKYFINMDSEEEGYLWISCAGGLTAVSEIPVRYEERTGVAYEIIIDGLLGGHSGAEIDKNRGNSNILMGRLIHQLNEKFDFSIAELAGGQKDNAIPRTTRMVICADSKDEAAIAAELCAFEADLKKEYSGTDAGITVTMKKTADGSMQVLDTISMGKLGFYLMFIPNGIQKMSGEIPGLVETSTNLGILKLGKKSVFASSSVRSSVGSAKDALESRIQYLTEFLGGIYKGQGAYPAWEYKKDSALRDLMVEVYEETFGEKPEVKAIHAGLECGLFYDKIPGLDCVSFGPTMLDIHTTEEKLSIPSTERMYRYLLRVLEAIH